MLKLSSGPGIKRPFQTDSEGYRSGSTPVTDALQEALVNALIHADHLGQGGIVIDRWLDRLEFSNPGTLLISREQLWQGGVSECRNKSLQLMFQMLGVGDKAGSGIDKIRSSWAAEHWQAPVLMEQLRPDRVMLELPMVSLLPEGALDALRLQFGDALDRLSGDEVRTVVTAQMEGQVTNRRLQGMLTLHSTDIGRMLSQLVSLGFLSSQGVGRGTRYFIAAAEAPPVGLGAPLVSAGAPPVSAGGPLVSEAGTPLVGAQMTGDRPRDKALDAPGRDALAKVQAQRRVRPELMRLAILHLCRDEHLTAQEIAERLHRSAGRLQEQFLTPLYRERRLLLRHQSSPHHPQQAYLTAPTFSNEASPS